MKLDSSTSGLTANTLQKNSSAFNAQNTNSNIAPAAGNGVGDAFGDNVHLSSASASLLSAVNDSSNDIDFGRVSDIKAAIANGTLRIDPAKIADGLILTTRELIQYPH